MQFTYDFDVNVIMTDNMSKSPHNFKDVFKVDILLVTYLDTKKYKCFVVEIFIRK